MIKKKIPFDIERAKKGEPFRVNKYDNSDNHHVLSNLDIITYRYKNGSSWLYNTTELSEMDDAFHEIPETPETSENPVAERWAVVAETMIYTDEKVADLDCAEYNSEENIYKVVKIV